MTRHLVACDMKRLNNLRQHYEAELGKQKIQYETRLQQYETRLQTLHDQYVAQCDLLETYRNQIFEIAKQPHNNITNHTHTTTTNNQRTVNIMNQLAPYEFDSDEIQRVLRQHFTSEVYNGGPDKIAELVAKFLLTDPETQKPRVVCTDASRKMFRYIDPESKELQTDTGLHNTHKIIKNPLVQANLSVFLETRQRDEPDEGDEHRDTWKRNDDFIEHQTKFPEKISHYLK